MLSTKTINKIYKITLLLFITITIYTILNTNTEKTLRTNLEINEIQNINNEFIYLLSDDNYLVKKEININNENIENKVLEIIENLKLKNNKNSLNGYIPKNVKVNDIIFQNNNLKINFNEEFNMINNKDLVISGIVNSLLEIEEIKSVEVLINNKYLNGYETPFYEMLDINKEYLISSRNDINKVVVYYYNEIDNEEYLTPVTKYINDDREKIEIIIEELSNNIPNNLISYLPNNLNLKNYRKENELMIIEIDNELITTNKEINNKIDSLIVESIFDNYDVNMVLFQKNGEKIEYFKKKA